MVGKKIFRKEKDYAAFEKILFEAKEKYNIRILAFCMMPNRWHLMLHPRTDVDLSQFMRWITLTHTRRFHTRYHSMGYGHLYQGRFKSFPVPDDEYFLHVCRSVERNPLRAGLLEKIDAWRWGSAWIRKHGSRERQNLLDLPYPRPPWADRREPTRKGFPANAGLRRAGKGGGEEDRKKNEIGRKKVPEPFLFVTGVLMLQKVHPPEPLPRAADKWYRSGLRRFSALLSIDCRELCLTLYNSSSANRTPFPL